jgi:hypothetical protein
MNPYSSVIRRMYIVEPIFEIIIVKIIHLYSKYNFANLFNRLQK